MRGLATKDLEFIKGNAKAMVMVVVVAFICFVSTSSGPSFLIGYVSIFAATMAWNTIGNDDMNNSMAYIFTLPFNRKDYVKEKYLFGTGMVFLMWGLAVLIACGVSALGYRTASFEELAGASVAGIFLAVFVIAVMFPIQMKYGSNAGRIALLTLVFGAMAVGWIGAEICDRMHIDLSFVKDAFMKIQNLGIPALAILAAVLLLLILLISCTISIKIMEKKEY